MIDQRRTAATLESTAVRDRTDVVKCLDELASLEQRELQIDLNHTQPLGHAERQRKEALLAWRRED